MNQGIGNNGIILACNNRSKDTPEFDYYATDPIAVEKLLNVHSFKHDVWEPCCGEGHISNVLLSHGYDVYNTDIIDRGCNDETVDFMKISTIVCGQFEEDIVTNPPYKLGVDFVKKAIEILANECQIALLLKLTFMCSKGRAKFFEENPPKFIYVFSDRIECAKNGNFEGKKGVDYAWFIWEKGWHGDTTLRWI